MGVSTDGILFFGITADDPWDHEDFAEMLEFDLDLIKNSDGLFIDEEGNEIDEYDLIYRIIEPHIPDGCTYSVHCSDNFSIPYIYAKQIMAERGHPEEVGPLPKIGGPTVKALAQLAEELNWLGPSWYLASWWG